jgi:hypothetical protein
MATDFTREQLHERAWKNPVRIVAGELGVSDVWLNLGPSRVNKPIC